MAADIKTKYGTSNQTITLTIASLGNGSARESTVVDNSTLVCLDALVQLKVKSNASGTSSTGVVNVYAYSSSDGGTTYTENATGSDAAITLTTPTNAVQVGIVNVVANATTYKSSPFSIAQAFGGILPQRWGIIIENKSGAALDATGGSHAAFYQGVFAQTV